MKALKFFAALTLTLIAVVLFGHQSDAATGVVTTANLITPVGNIFANKTAKPAFKEGITPDAYHNLFQNSTLDIAFADGDAGLLYTPRSGKLWSYTVKITNKVKTDEVILLTPSYEPSSANVMVEGNFNSVAGNAMNAVGQTKTVTTFLKYLADNPSRCVGINTTYDNPLQKGKSIKVYIRDVPFVGSRATDDRIEFADYKTPGQYDDKQLIITEPFWICPDTEIQLEVAGTSAVAGGGGDVPSVINVTFKFDATLNLSNYFRMMTGFVK
jgi:hypothetical protein